MEIHYYQKFHHFVPMPFFGNFAPSLTQSQVRHCDRDFVTLVYYLGNREFIGFSIRPDVFSVHRLIYERKTLRIDLINLCLFNLRIVKGKKPTQIKLQLFRKEWIWTFWWLVHQVNPLHDVLKLEKNFKKHKDITGKTLFSVIGSFYTPLSICLNIGFWQSNFESCYFHLKKDTPVFWKGSAIFRKFVSKLSYWKRSKFPVIVT